MSVSITTGKLGCMFSEDMPVHWSEKRRYANLGFNFFYYCEYCRRPWIYQSGWRRRRYRGNFIFCFSRIICCMPAHEATFTADVTFSTIVRVRVMRNYCWQQWLIEKISPCALNNGLVSVALISDLNKQAVRYWQAQVLFGFYLWYVD